jgi:DNA-binding HxlR family transcriptional regulator
MAVLPFDDETIRRARRIAGQVPPDELDPRVEALVNDLIGRVADKWTMLILEELEQHGVLRFTQLSRQVPGISQKMLTQTLRQMEREGLVTRTVHPVIPPHVDYALTPLGASLGAAFCGVCLAVTRGKEAASGDHAGEAAGEESYGLSPGPRAVTSRQAGTHVFHPAAPVRKPKR